MCAAIISNIPFIFLENKNLLNRRAPTVKYELQPVVGGYGLFLVNDNIMQNSDNSNSHPVD